MSSWLMRVFCVVIVGVVTVHCSTLRVRRSGPALPRGIPLNRLFASCSLSPGVANSSAPDIGPCMAKILRGGIRASRDYFSTGIKIGGRKRVLEPLKLKDIREKQEKRFRISAKDFYVHGLSSVDVLGVRFDPHVLSLSVGFEHLRATARLTMRYLFLMATPNVSLTLHQVRLNITSNWRLDYEPNNDGRGNLYLVLSDSLVHFDVDRVSANIENLSGLGTFLQSVLNSNGRLLADFFLPSLRKEATEKVNEELNRIEIS